MSVRKTVLCPYTRWEFDRVEGWCEEMERRGLRLVRFKGQFAVLEDGAPRDTASVRRRRVRMLDSRKNGRSTRTSAGNCSKIRA